ncbi:MAG: hypothetical protein KDB80_05315, partial [Planctomycetes bacterium]|nr:hypothetical protein [Planctomycetota bacterium]
LSSFTAADGDYASLRVQSLVGGLTLSDGVNSVVVTASGLTDLTYTGTSATLAVADFADGATLSITDANDLLDALTVAAQVGKSLGAVDIAGNLTSFTAADGDFSSLRVQSLVGSLTLGDGVNSVVVTASGLTDLTYTGTGDALVVADFVDGATLSFTDPSGLLDALTITTQVGKSLGAIDVAGSLTSFTATDGDYASLRVQSLLGGLTISDGVDSVLISVSAASDVLYSGVSDTLTMLDFTDGAALTITDAMGLVDSISVASQVGKSLGAIDVFGDLDAFTASDSDFYTLRITESVGSLILGDGVSSVQVVHDSIMDLAYIGAGDTLFALGYADGAGITVTDPSGLVDSLFVGAQSGAALGRIDIVGDLDSFRAAASTAFDELHVTALAGGLTILDGVMSRTIDLTSGAAEIVYGSAAGTVGGALSILGTVGTSASSVLSIDDITGGLQIASVNLGGVLQGFSTNAVIGSLVSAFDIQSISVGGLLGSIDISGLVADVNGVLLELDLAGDSLALLSSIASIDLDVSFVATATGNVLHVLSNTVGGLALDIEDPGRALAAIILEGDLVEVPAITTSSPTTEIFVESRPTLEMHRRDHFFAGEHDEVGERREFAAFGEHDLAGGSTRWMHRVGGMAAFAGAAAADGSEEEAQDELRLAPWTAPWREPDLRPPEPVAIEPAAEAPPPVHPSDHEPSEDSMVEFDADGRPIYRPIAAADATPEFEPNSMATPEVSDSSPGANSPSEHDAMPGDRPSRGNRR